MLFAIAFLYGSSRQVASLPQGNLQGVLKKSTAIRQFTSSFMPLPQ
jgi:hypothetical protein